MIKLFSKLIFLLTVSCVLLLVSGCFTPPDPSDQDPECYTDSDCKSYGSDFICDANGDCSQCPAVQCTAPPAGCGYESDNSARCPGCGELVCDNICKLNSECNPGYTCVAGECKKDGVITITPPTCSDKKQNQGETGVDCGGPCIPCTQSQTSNVYFTSPFQGEKFIVNRPIYLRADMLGLNSVSKVEFWKGHHEILDNTKSTDKIMPSGVIYFGSDISEPYELYVKKLPIGIHDITIKIFTNSGEVNMKSTSLEVINEPSNPSYCIKNGKDECEELFYYSDKEYTRTYKYYCRDSDGDGNYGFDSMGWHEGFRLNGLAGAYEAFHDKEYLLRMVRDINAVLCIDEGISENDCEICPLSYQGYGQYPSNTPKEWGWYGDTYSTKDGVEFDYMVGEGQIVKGIARYIEFVKLNPELENEKYGTYTYKQLADKYLEEIENLYDKWERRDMFREVGDGTGAYTFHDDPYVHNGHPRMNLPHNQQVEWAGAMLILYRITEDVKYRDRAAKILYHLKKNFYEEQGVVNWNYWDHSGVWDYTMGEGQEKYGGLEHWEGEEHKMGYKRISVSAMIEGWRNCLVFDDEDIEGAMQRSYMFGKIPREDTSTLNIPLLGQYDQSNIELEFDKLSKMDDNPNQWGYVSTSRFKLISGEFWETLKSPKEKFFVCNLKEIPIYQTFDGATTNFKNVEDITSVSNVVLEKEGFGKIEFGDISLDMANLFLDAYVQIGQNYISIDGEELPELDIPATVTLYNVNNDRPAIMRDNKVCYPSCERLTEGKNTKFTIPGAGRYHVAPDKNLLFKDDFESGDFSKWAKTNTKNKISVTSSQKRSGSKSLEVSFGDEVEMYLETQDFNVKDYVYKVSFMLSDNFKLKTNKYDRNFNFGNNPTTETGKNIIMIDYKRGADIAIEEWSYANHIYFQYTDNNGWEHWVPKNRMAGPVLENGRWYDIEYHFVSDPNGYVDVYLDGEFLGRSTMGDTSESKQRNFRLGVMPEALWSGTAEGKIYYDNFEVYEILR